jgi:hypothetical protein
MRPRRLALVVVAATCFVLSQSPAQAAPPVLNDLQFNAGVMSASWSLPPGVEAVFFEGSLKPNLNSDGGFTELDILEDLQPDATAYSLTQRQEPGTYYIHIVGADTSCDSCPTFEYSAIRTVVVTYGFRADANTTCRAYFGDVASLLDRARSVRTVRQAAALARDSADLLDAIRADLRDNPTPPTGTTPTGRFKSMLSLMHRSANLFRGAANDLLNGRRNRAIRRANKAASLGIKAGARAKQLKLGACKRILG